MIEARITIEMMGQPENILMKALEEAVHDIGEHNKVEKVYYSKPKKVGQTLYSAFTEFIVKLSSYSDLIGIITDYVPTVVEVLSPNEVKVTLEELQNSLNDFVAIINAFDKRLKIAQSHIMILQNESKNNKKKQK